MRTIVICAFLALAIAGSARAADIDTSRSVRCAGDLLWCGGLLPFIAKPA